MLNTTRKLKPSSDNLHLFNSSERTLSLCDRCLWWKQIHPALQAVLQQHQQIEIAGLVLKAVVK
ncbi:MAG: hypothetical protein V7K65_15055 [Nostoc sp.]